MLDVLCAWSARERLKKRTYRLPYTSLTAAPPLVPRVPKGRAALACARASGQARACLASRPAQQARQARCGAAQLPSVSTANGGAASGTTAPEPRVGVGLAEEAPSSEGEDEEETPECDGSVRRFRSLVGTAACGSGGASPCAACEASGGDSNGGSGLSAWGECRKDIWRRELCKGIRKAHNIVELCIEIWQRRIRCRWVLRHEWLRRMRTSFRGGAFFFASRCAAARGRERRRARSGSLSRGPP